MGDHCIYCLDNEVFKNFVFYASIVLIKMSMMSFWTARHRLGKTGLESEIKQVRSRTTGRFLSTYGQQITDPFHAWRKEYRLSDDFNWANTSRLLTTGPARIKVFNNPEDYTGRRKTTPVTLTTDPDVERVRRCHQNDIENVLPFVLIGLLYVSTGPQLSTASWFFRIFAGSRLLHTVVYLNAIPQPARFMVFVPGITVNMLMAVSSLSATWF